MGFEANLQGFNLGEVVSGAVTQYTLVRHDGTNVVQSGAGENGYSLQDPTTAAASTTPEIASVMTYGISKVLLGGTVIRGAALASNASGRAVAAATGNEVVGRALEGGVSGDIIGMVVEPVGGAQLN